MLFRSTSGYTSRNLPMLAKMAGLPRAVIKTAEDMMTKMQIDYSKDLSANKRKSKVPTPDVPQLSLVFGDKD